MKKSIVACALISALSGTTAWAGDVSFSGYGSFRAGLTLDDNYIPPDFGYDDEVDFKNESLFALQAKTQINDKWNATIVLQASGDKDFDVEARWAYLSYEITPDTTLSLGRFALPYFRNSDTQNIGYSHNYARMPSAIYKGQNFDIVEGVRLTHTELVGDGEININASYSNYDGEVKLDLGTSSAEFKDIIQLSAEYSYDWFSIYMGYMTTSATLDINENLDQVLVGSLPGYSVVDNVAYNPSGQAVYQMKNIYMEEDRTSYASIGFTAEHNQWLFNAEYVAYDADDSFFQELSAYYVSLAYRMDTVAISLVHQDFSVDFENDHASANDPYINAYAKSVSNALFINEEYDSQGIHVRYDAAQGIAYKFEYTHVNGDYSDESTGIVTFGVDFIF